MAENSAIEWCDHTFNPWEGCQKVGPGCDHCYAETRNARFGGGTAVNWGPGAPRRRTSASNWRKPRQWQAAAAQFLTDHGRRQRVFCASLADVFDNAADPAWRTDLFALIRDTPDLDWLLLTKRIGNVANMLPVPFDFESQYPNVWLGATVVNQAEAERDVPKLLATPARVRFLSIEPMLGPISLEQAWYGENALDSECWGNCGWCEKGYPPLWNCQRDWSGARYEAGARCRSGLDWIIVGGESGPGARPLHPDWARQLRDECEAASVPFLFKQWGEHDLSYDRERDDPDWRRCGDQERRPGRWINLEGGWGFHGERVHYAARVGKKAAGRLLDGLQHDGAPG
ncbi:protein gp37 [Sphingomonas jinjuensis]|uniref:Protein gp37 n=1 Tax=Sphingomonas jinjuensis TaxID=535907 RepID=A0A840FEH8_9SPHN|nr:phage Gp37/Gp68 family protein [Sphingomonas jinjuensis]MBB4154134.1 protein gp37 [Sphingomonas jinjuensis]